MTARDIHSTAWGPSPSADRPRFDFLHGVRGLAALYVMVFHATLNARIPPESTLGHLQAPLLHGYLGVTVFLVLSGFLLAAPAVTGGFRLRGGITGFMRRRAIRILLPYYAAYLLYMAFYLAAAWLGDALGRDPGFVVQEQLRIGYGWPTFIAHILLVQNLSSEWVAGMSAILWSIACEWQIYLLFAVVLVPLWRRRGALAMLAACAALAIAVNEACIAGWCHYHLPWMIPVFGIGSVASLVVLGSTPVAARMRQWRWGPITAIACAALIGGVTLLDMAVPGELPDDSVDMPYYRWSYRIRWAYDVLGALVAASAIIWLSLDGKGGRAAGAVSMRVRRLLESAPLMALGLCAYSLYLTHGMVLVAVDRATEILLPFPEVRAVVSMSCTVTISLGVAWTFYLLVERHCMSSETRKMFLSTPRSARIGS